MRTQMLLPQRSTSNKPQPCKRPPRRVVKTQEREHCWLLLF